MSGEIIKRAEEAAFLLEHEVFCRAFAEYEKRILRAWKGAAGTGEREEQFYRMSALHGIKKMLLDDVNEAAEMDARNGRQESPWRVIHDNHTEREKTG